MVGSNVNEDGPTTELFSLDGRCLPEVSSPPETEKNGFLTQIDDQLVYCFSRESYDYEDSNDYIHCSVYNSRENKWNTNYTKSIGTVIEGSALVYNSKIYFYRFFNPQCVAFDLATGKNLDINNNPVF